jgi:hypothetical protein
VGKLWEEIRDGSVVWRDQTPGEAQRERRRELFRTSSVPWIVNDALALLQFYDDAQDLISFTRWNKRLLSPKGFGECMRRQASSGVVGAGAVARCLCPLGSGRGKRVTGGVGGGFNLRGGLLAGVLGALWPGCFGGWGSSGCRSGRSTTSIIS